jgi:hypothetical protein
MAFDLLRDHRDNVPSFNDDVRLLFHLDRVNAVVLLIQVPLY